MAADPKEPAVGEPRRPRGFGFDAAPRTLDRSYSKYVRGLKVILPATAAMIVIIVFAWPQVQLHEKLPDPENLRIRPQDTADLTVLGVRYSGTDSEDRPYTVTAASTRQANAESDKVVLEKPEAGMDLQDGRKVALRADTGIFDREHSALSLNGAVRFSHDGGFEIATDGASIDFRDGEAHGDQPVSVRAPDGVGQAEGFKVVDGGRRVFLTGKASLQLKNTVPHEDGS